MPELDIRTVRVHVDFPVAMYRALVLICERLHCTIGVLIIRIASKALQPKSTALAEAEPDQGELKRLRSRVASETASTRNARTRVDALRAELREVKKQASRDHAEAVRAAVDALESGAGETAAQLRKANRRIERLTAALQDQRARTLANSRELTRLRKIAVTPTLDTRPAPTSADTPVPHDHLTALHAAGASTAHLGRILEITTGRARRELITAQLPIPHKGPRSPEVLARISAIQASLLTTDVDKEQ